MPVQSWREYMAEVERMQRGDPPDPAPAAEAPVVPAPIEHASNGNGQLETKEQWPITVTRDMPGFLLGVGGSTGRPTYPRQNVRNWTAEGYRKNELVFACIDYIARTASLPTIRAHQRSRAGGAPTKLGDDHPANTLITNPRDKTSEAWFLAELLVLQWVAGNGIAWIRRDPGDNLPIELHWMRPDRLKRVVNGADQIVQYAYVVAGLEFPIEPADVLHHKFAYDPSDPSWGLSPIAVLARRITVDNTATDFVASFFANAAVPYGMITTEQILQRADADELAARWEERYTGLDGWHRPAVLGRGARYERLGLNMAEMALPELNAVSEARIAMDLFVPPILVGAKVGLDRSTYSNYAEARLAIWEDVLVPAYGDIADTWTDQLGPEFGEGIVYVPDYSQVPALREANAARFTRALDGWEKGMLSLDESRHLAGYEPIPNGGGDVFKRKVIEEVAPLDVQATNPAEAVVRGTTPPGPVVPGKADVVTEAKAAARAAKRRNAGAGWRRDVHRLRETYVPRIRDRLEQFVARLGDRVMSRAQAGRFLPSAKAGAKRKPFVGRGAELLRQTDVKELDRILAAYFDAIGGDTVRVANLVYDLGLLYEDSPARLATLARSARASQQIVGTLTDEIEKRMALADRRGWTVTKLIEGEEDAGGLAAVFGKGDPGSEGFLSALDRAERIARTTFTTAANVSSSAAFRSGGVENVLVHDGSGLGDRCDEIDGEIWTVDQAEADELEHPNCTRIFEPLIGEGEAA